MVTTGLSYSYSTLLVGVIQYVFALIIISLFLIFAFWKLKKGVRKTPNKNKTRNTYDRIFGNDNENPNEMIEKLED